MAVIKRKRGRYTIGPIGLTTENRANVTSALSMAEDVDRLTKIAVEEGRKEAIRYGEEQAMSMPMKMFYTLGDDGDFKAYSSEVFQNMGSNAREAFKVLAEKRYFEDVNNDLKIKYKEYKDKFSIGSGGAEAFNQAFNDYGFNLSANAPNKFKQQIIDITKDYAQMGYSDLFILSKERQNSRSEIMITNSMNEYAFQMDKAEKNDDPLFADYWYGKMLETGEEANLLEVASGSHRAAGFGLKINKQIEKVKVASSIRNIFKSKDLSQDELKGIKVYIAYGNEDWLPKDENGKIDSNLKSIIDDYKETLNSDNAEFASSYLDKLVSNRVSLLNEFSGSSDATAIKTASGDAITDLRNKFLKNEDKSDKNVIELMETVGELNKGYHDIAKAFPKVFNSEDANSQWGRFISQQIPEKLSKEIKRQLRAVDELNAKTLRNVRDYLNDDLNAEAKKGIPTYLIRTLDKYHQMLKENPIGNYAPALMTSLNEKINTKERELEKIELDEEQKRKEDESEKTVENRKRQRTELDDDGDNELENIIALSKEGEWGSIKKNIDAYEKKWRTEQLKDWSNLSMTEINNQVMRLKNEASFQLTQHIMNTVDNKLEKKAFSKNQFGNLQINDATLNLYKDVVDYIVNPGVEKTAEALKDSGLEDVLDLLVDWTKDDPELGEQVRRRKAHIDSRMQEFASRLTGKKAEVEKQELTENMGSGIAGSSKKTSDISTEILQNLLIKDGLVTEKNTADQDGMAFLLSNDALDLSKDATRHLYHSVMKGYMPSFMIETIENWSRLNDEELRILLTTIDRMQRFPDPNTGRITNMLSLYMGSHKGSSPYGYERIQDNLRAMNALIHVGESEGWISRANQTDSEKYLGSDPEIIINYPEEKRYDSPVANYINQFNSIDADSYRSAWVGIANQSDIDVGENAKERTVLNKLLAKYDVIPENGNAPEEFISILKYSIIGGIQSRELEENPKAFISSAMDNIKGYKNREYSNYNGNIIDFNNINKTGITLVKNGLNKQFFGDLYYYALNEIQNVLPDGYIFDPESVADEKFYELIGTDSNLIHGDEVAEAINLKKQQENYTTSAIYPVSPRDIAEASGEKPEPLGPDIEELKRVKLVATSLADGDVRYMAYYLDDSNTFRNVLTLVGDEYVPVVFTANTIRQHLKSKGIQEKLFQENIAPALEKRKALFKERYGIELQ